MIARKTLFLLVTFCTVLCYGNSKAWSQNDPPSTTDTKPVKVETIAVLPWYYEKGTDGAQKTAKDFLATLLVKTRVDAVSEVKTLTAWEEANKAFYETSETLPSPAQMLRVGEKLGTDWVLAGKLSWHSRSIWVGLGPKTKSTCTISVRLVNVKDQEVALEVEGLKMDSTAKEDTLKALGTVFVSGLFTFVSGGPKTPHEQRAAQLAIAKALEPWLIKHIKPSKIDPKAK